MMSVALERVRQVDPSPSCSEFHSTRIESMIAGRSEFETELEFRTAHSKVHWSELMSASGHKDLNEEPVEDHGRDFAELRNDCHWGSFCNKVFDVVLGKKLGEGAQADIYEAQVTFVKEHSYKNSARLEYVVKVMKADCALADLQRQWPRGLGVKPLDAILKGSRGLCARAFYAIIGGQDSGLYGALYKALVKDPVTHRNRFCFVMERYLGDLRILIDLRMDPKNNVRDRPFPVTTARWYMFWIADEMSFLHEMGIIHRDLKASNVLVPNPDQRELDYFKSSPKSPRVADYECSVGVVGTGFWRAPEILLQLKTKVPSSKLEFSEKVDVYSFAMTCYEIVTGLIPFEGLPNTTETRDAILNGARPKLPRNLDPKIREIITSCWDPSPSLRPSFDNLAKVLKDAENLNTC